MLNDTNDRQRRDFLRISTLGILGLSTIPHVISQVEAKQIEDYSKLSDDKLFSLIRKQMLLTEGLVYLNTGTLGPSPRMVVDKVSEVMHLLESNPSIKNGEFIGDDLEAVRLKMASFINAQLDEVILTRNTTEGISIVCSKLNLKIGDEILTTDNEHGGAETGLDYLARTKQAVIKKIKMPIPVSNKQQILDLVDRHITSRTKVLLLSHVETITGLRLPIEEIAEMVRPRGIFFIVDGAQAAGMINVDVKKIGADVYAGSGHKWILGPKETGFLYIRKEVQDRIDHVFLTGGYGVYTHSSGTRNASTIIGLGAALDWHQAIGKDRIEKRCLSMAKYCYGELEKLDDVKIISTADPELSSGIISVSLKKKQSRDIFMRMLQENITIKLLPKYNAVRFSTHIFNSKVNVDRMINYLKEMTG